MPRLARRPLPPLPWPLPAVLAWGLGWAALVPGGFGAGVAASLLAAWIGCSGLRRRAIAAAGFPLSALALGATSLPDWGWLVLLLPLLAAYPLRAWRDAPFFPTPRHALAGLPALLQQAPASALDAGCGIGHGLHALRAAFPDARLTGVEWSAPLALLARWRCRGVAQVTRGDMWAADWSMHDLVYVFQRPESMARAWTQATQQMAAGSWLVSLEFAVPGVTPSARLGAPGERPLWVYRIGRHSTAGARRR